MLIIRVCKYCKKLVIGRRSVSDIEAEVEAGCGLRDVSLSFLVYALICFKPACVAKMPKADRFTILISWC